MWYMRPLSVSTDVSQPRERVYDFLDVLANHELFAVDRRVLRGAIASLSDRREAIIAAIDFVFTGI